MKSIYLILRPGERERQPVVGNVTIACEATTEHVTPRNLTNGSAGGNCNLYAVRACSYATKQRSKSGNRCILCISRNCPFILSKSKLYYDRQSVGQSVLVSGTHLGLATNFSFSLKFSVDSCRFVIS
jgi:hypothetical protein